jgi:TolB-like protein
MVRGWRVVAVFILLSCALPLTALPQLAVLNVVLSAGIDPTVAGIITGKIEEPIVASGRFEVLDRSSVDQVLTEKEFQLSSGLVKAEEARQAGEYLGADLIVAGTVSRVGQTYALSAKMIDVATGKVVAQASAEKEGKIDVLLPLARQVGEQLAAKGPGGRATGGAREQPAEPAPAAPAAPPFFRHTALLGAGFTEVGAYDTVVIAAAYFFSLRPKVGLTANASFNLDGAYYSFNAGAFFTPFPALSVGITGGYASETYNEEYTWDTITASGFSIGPVLLLRIRRLAIGAGVVFVPGGDEILVFYGGVGFNF